MLIDYSRMDKSLIKYFKYDDVHSAYNPGVYTTIGNRIKLPKNSDFDLTIIPLTYKREKRIKTVKKIFGTKEVEETVSVPDRTGFRIASANDTCFLLKDSENNRVYLKIDYNTLAPEIKEQPDNISELCAIVRQDPRFMQQIDPTKISKQNLTLLCEAASQGLRNVLGYQAEYGEKFDDAELEERERYVRACEESVKVFMQRWAKVQSLLNESEKESK